MKKIVSMLLLILVLFSPSFARTLLYYPEKTCYPTSSTELACTAGICGILTVGAVFDMNKITRLSKKPLLLNGDIRYLKRQTWLSLVGGFLQTTIGIVSIVEANERCEECNASYWYGISAINFVGAGIRILAAQKAGKVISSNKVP